MKKKDHLHDELNKEAPLLNTLREKGAGFRVPAEYFEQLESDVFRQLDAIGARRKPATGGATGTGWWLPFQQLWQPRFALAFAGVLTLALAAWWYFRPHTAQSNAPEIAAAVPVTAEDAAAYLMDNLMELDPALIALALPSPDDLPAITLEPVENPEPEATEKQAQEIEISTEDLENLLRDMSDEELKNLMM